MLLLFIYKTRRRSQREQAESRKDGACKRQMPAPAMAEVVGRRERAREAHTANAEHARARRPSVVCRPHTHKTPT